jgi:hypothetical protein
LLVSGLAIYDREKKVAGIMAEPAVANTSSKWLMAPSPGWLMTAPQMNHYSAAKISKSLLSARLRPDGTAAPV